MSATIYLGLIGIGLLGLGICISLFFKEHKPIMKEIIQVPKNPEEVLKVNVEEIQIRQSSDLERVLQNLVDAVGRRDHSLVKRYLLRLNEDLHIMIDNALMERYLKTLATVRKVYEAKSNVIDAKSDFENQEILQAAKRAELQTRLKKAELDNAGLDKQLNEIKNPTPPPPKPPQKSAAERRSEWQAEFDDMMKRVAQYEAELKAKGTEEEDLLYLVNEYKTALGYYELLKRRP